mgnify:FL=1
MTSESVATDKKTYFPHEKDAEIVDFVEAMKERGMSVPSARAALVGEDNERIELPTQLHSVLVQVAEALMEGLAVSVVPQTLRLTTQQAADYLGISRPTLVRILERGEIPMTKPGRHRYVQLRDLEAYEQKMRERRHKILDEMAHEATDSGLYDATAGPPGQMR